MRRIFIGLLISISATGFSQEDPCFGVGGIVIHFDKKTDSLLETPCDSIIHFARFIQDSPTDTFALLGIQTIRPGFKTNSNIQIDREKALDRARRLKVALVELGIDPNRLHIYTTFHQPPAPDAPHDWPFYPESYDFEIGVYLQMHY